MSIRIDTKKIADAQRLITNVLESTAVGSGRSIPERVVEEYLPRARADAPKFSGATRKALQKIDYKKSSKLRLNQPVQKRIDGPRDYHLWMHGIGKYNIGPHIRSGNPHFMFKAADEMEKMVGDDIATVMRK